jgi:flagellar biosynthesis/type III secretory pathway ATPase
MNDGISKTAIAKMAVLPEILKAATLLHELGLQAEQPNETVKRYINANPEINQFLKQQSATTPQTSQIKWRTIT